MTKDVDRAPGPGAYKPNDSPLKIAPSYGFGTASQRQALPPPTAPGPGNYRIPCEIANLPGYTGSKSKDYAYV